MNQKVYFPNLDGLRFFAFFYVFMYHCYFEVPEVGKDSPFYLAFYKLWENGDLGVNFFFTLSGFLITYLLLVEERKNGGFSIQSFYWRRTLRIWPLYFTTMIFGYFIFQMLLDLVNAEIQETANIWYYVFFLGNFNSIINGSPVSGSLAVLWSLAIEEQFYLFWPILLLIFKRARLVLFLILIFISLVFRGLHYQDHTLIFYHSFSVMSDLVIGAFLAWWSFGRNLQLDQSLSISKKWNVLIYLVGFVLILFRKDLFVIPVFVIIERLIFSLFFAFIIFDQTFSKTSLFKIASLVKISFWGKFTYGLYCLHMPAMVFTEGFAMIGGIHESAWWVTFGKTTSTLLLSLIFCRLSFRFIESPFLRLKERMVGFRLGKNFKTRNHKVKIVK
jgi:peptidoglycan/LPS O-acetylase OafA/YrhL